MNKHIILFERYEQYNEIENLPNFVGYHCSPYYIENFNGRIVNSQMNTYGKGWFAGILDALGWVKQLSTMPDLSSDSPKADKWIAMVENMLDRRNIRWIFVARDAPKTMYGSYEYGVTIDDSKVLAILDDVNEIDSDIYIYNDKKVQPKIIPLFEPPKKKVIVKSAVFTPDKNEEGLGLFTKSNKYDFPWNRTENEYRNDKADAKYLSQLGHKPYPYPLSLENEKLICSLLGVKPYSIGEHEALILFKKYMDAQ